MNQLFGVVGIAAILVLAWLLSANRKAIRLRVVAAAFALQAAIAWLVIWTSWGRAAIQGMSNGVANLLGYATKGTEFLFGPSISTSFASRRSWPRPTKPIRSASRSRKALRMCSASGPDSIFRSVRRSTARKSGATIRYASRRARMN